MAGILVIIIVAAGVYYKMVYATPNAKAVRQLTRGKNEEQKKVIEYFTRQGCLVKTMSDAEYLDLITKKRDSLNLRDKAISRIGLDEDEIKEISPIRLEGPVFKNAYSKKMDNGKFTSSRYQVTWIFFSKTQVHLYTYTFDMDEDKKQESTEEYFYQDVTSFTTSNMTETAKYMDGQVEKTREVETSKFKMVVPGDQMLVAMDGDVQSAEESIQGMKSMLREKKSQQ
ncbi:hypothetical protein ACFQ5J_09705 [Lacticaseibacillus baoqingensis]|uniref:Uncharacterized protein n=1 Tax=Lacticaseibacillus baoqingensis TaxID=2486013 RepID=A0ABW4E7A1_9LACO|nr:hypothetical protein [Lacticaseibacillus baoqingensis]